MTRKDEPVAAASRRIAAMWDRGEFPAKLTKECLAAQSEALARAPRKIAPEELHKELADSVICTAASRAIMADDADFAANALQLATNDPILRFLWGNSLLLASAADIPSTALRDWVKQSWKQEREPVWRDLVSLYERLIASRDGRERRRGGVWGTPWLLARLMTRSIDQQLKRDWGLSRGLAEPNHHRLWDPAAGSGIFAAAAFVQGLEACRSIDGWRDYSIEEWLPHWNSDELRLAPWSLSHWVLAALFSMTMIVLKKPVEVGIHWGDALAEPSAVASSCRHDWPQDAAATVRIPIILGNPPYGSLSLTSHEWMERLMRGVDFDGTSRANYHAVDGQPLGERKTWLQDDYVKFLRRAHAEVERAGQGIVCLVTNHGYLDNPTFRGVRRALQQTFANISVLDLHGNATRRERTPAGSPDHNLFGIETGVAVGLFSTRPRAESPESAGEEIIRGDLWGDVVEKQKALVQTTVASLANERCQPRPPDFAFVRNRDNFPEYTAGIPLHELMPFSTSAIVTARDRLAIAFSREELIARLEELRDPRIPDDEIRSRYLRSRSPRHAEGNTRGWDLAQAREALRADPDWQTPIETCLYRPFDVRWIYYSSLLVDWPRRQGMESLLRGEPAQESLAIIARRQMPAGQPCNYFWASDRPVVDGVIRSDNRGNETIFPLWRFDAEGLAQPNFAREGVQRLTDQNEPSSQARLLLAGYVYALFWTPSYQARYADSLRTGFPRVLIPRSRALYERIGRIGERLMSRHILRDEHRVGERIIPCRSGGVVEPGFPKYDEGRIRLAPGMAFSGVPPEVWNFQAGAHQVARKWLKDRRGKELSAAETTRYHAILTAIEGTLELQASLDAMIAEAGGFTEAFVG